jgi:hypothetical protein
LAERESAISTPADTRYSGNLQANAYSHRESVPLIYFKTRCNNGK